MRAHKLPLWCASDALKAHKYALAHPVGMIALGMKLGESLIHRINLQGGGLS